jgi:hypothetical protein
MPAHDGSSTAETTAKASLGQSMRRFALADAKATVRTAVRAFAWTTRGLGVALFAAVLFNPQRVEPMTAASATATLIAALVYAAVPGVVVAAGAVLFRVAGAWAFLPLVVLPVATLGVFWLGRGALAGHEQDVWNAWEAQIRGNWSVLKDVRVHDIYALMAVLLLYGAVTALQPPVLWELFQFLLLVGAFLVMSLVLTCLVTLPPLIIAMARRTAWRYAKHMALAGATDAMVALKERRR